MYSFLTALVITLDHISHSMGYSENGSGFRKGGEHASTHFGKVKWHYIKSSISICGLLLLLWVWQRRVRARWAKRWAVLFSLVRERGILWSLEPPTEKDQELFLMPYWAVYKLVGLTFKAIIHLWPFSQHIQALEILINKETLLMYHKTSSTTWKCSSIITFCPNPQTCTAAVNQAVKVSLCRHKNGGGHGCMGMGERLT